ncbi:hypothetical protein [Paracoccus sp. (in: a-proteobacteria)]|uniref:hypothetical protein n=1 Tax=Paracoccus sp. TaxID=267 RepID=UPI0028982968|nr:hypothetical protein [Paracoccus sp. (in: a-proteobacteria)]
MTRHFMRSVAIATAAALCVSGFSAHSLRAEGGNKAPQTPPAPAAGPKAGSAGQSTVWPNGGRSSRGEHAIQSKSRQAADRAAMEAARAEKAKAKQDAPSATPKEGVGGDGADGTATSKADDVLPTPAPSGD